ncbi:winged helix-turn-helix transcriptional regulator [Vulcanisaeta thermophila]|uniref:winged helix-turn-helix transcriptional regulator n=1 Tax=Vulcanisaeta thermophila TaxID=867917 RepID=UPI00085355D2|nr:winged helix-turn-helix transcriptional regulator [Vulcanisaeta thermophila]
MRLLIISMPSIADSLKRELGSGVADVVTDVGGVKVQDYDVIGIAGTDKFIITSLHKLNDVDKPILTIGLGTGFLNSVDLPNLRGAIDAIKGGDYEVEEITRLMAVIKGKSLPHAINEVAIFPSKSATTLEYNLYIDDEYIWHDVADGIIVSTPTGSTAYAMSAGGPLIHAKARVFEVVPVNSTNLARVPIVIPDECTVVIKDLVSRSRVEVIIDGSVRAYAGDEVRIMRGNALRLVRFNGASSTIGRYERKINLIANMDLPPSAKFIMKVLEYEGQLTQREISEKTMLPGRTIRYALNLLMRKGLVTKQTILRGNKPVIVYSLSGKLTSHGT